MASGRFRGQVPRRVSGHMRVNGVDSQEAAITRSVGGSSQDPSIIPMEVDESGSQDGERFPTEYGQESEMVCPLQTDSLSLEEVLSFLHDACGKITHYQNSEGVSAYFQRFRSLLD